MLSPPKARSGRRRDFFSQSDFLSSVCSTRAILPLQTTFDFVAFHLGSISLGTSLHGEEKSSNFWKAGPKLDDVVNFFAHLRRTTRLKTRFYDALTWGKGGGRLVRFQRSKLNPCKSCCASFVLCSVALIYDLNCVAQSVTSKGCDSIS